MFENAITHITHTRHRIEIVARSTLHVIEQALTTISKN